MPTPYNNPYIPGDPYSYDLKWLVAKVKEILLQLDTLDEAIEKKIFDGFIEHSIVQFHNVPEMLAADMKDGSIVFTLGYHEAGDQGALFYLVKDFNPGQCSLDYFLTMDNNAQIAIPVIVTPYVTPEMFGAYGDNDHDDADAFTKAFTYPVVILGEKSYKIYTQIATTSPIHLQGAGSEKTKIYSNAASYAFIFGTESVAWRASEYIIEDLSVYCDNGAIELSNGTQSVIKNCRFYGVNAADVNNVLITNESHYATIENCYIYGGNGIVVEQSNDVRIINNYVTYCNDGITLNGNDHVVKHNDVEGFTKTPYIINCNGSDIDVSGERNISGTWCKVAGNLNKIRARMGSTGGNYYNPLFEMNGNANDIEVNLSSGYTILDVDNGLGNSYRIRRAYTLTNSPVFAQNAIPPSKMPDDEGELVFDIAADDLTPFITSAAGTYTYDASTHRVTLNGTDPFTLDFSSLRNDDGMYFIYFEKTGISAPGHGQMAIYAQSNDTGTLVGMNEKVMCIHNTNKMFTNPSFSGIYFSIDKLRVAKYFTSKLIK